MLGVEGGEGGHEVPSDARRAIEELREVPGVCGEVSCSAPGLKRFLTPGHSPAGALHPSSGLGLRRHCVLRDDEIFAGETQLWGRSSA